jgi:nucleotide-binding universal stress UspA family protein
MAPIDMDGFADAADTALGTSTIVVPLGGSEDAAAALPVARAIARLEEVPLQVLHIAERTLPPRDLLRKLGLEPRDVEGSIIDQAGGDPAEEILRIAAEQEAPYIVLPVRPEPAGTAAAGAIPPRRPAGRVARQILARAPCPVVVVPPGCSAAWMPRHILLPFDGAPATAQAACQALEFAARARADITVVHVAAPGLDPSAEPGSISLPRYVDQVQHEWPAWASEFLDRACWTSGWTGRIRLAVALGDPGEEIVRMARERRVDLIVIACRGAWASGEGVASARVLRDPPCPVLVSRKARA